MPTIKETMKAKTRPELAAAYRVLIGKAQEELTPDEAEQLQWASAELGIGREGLDVHRQALAEAATLEALVAAGKTPAELAAMYSTYESYAAETKQIVQARAEEEGRLLSAYSIAKSGAAKAVKATEELAALRARHPILFGA